MKRTSGGIIKNIDWNLCIYGVLEKNVILGNLRTIWDIDKEKIDYCDHHHLFDLIMDHRISKPHLNITLWCSTTGAPPNTVKQKVDRLKKQQKKNKECAALTRSSSSTIPMGSPFCAICDKKDDKSNLQAAGTQGATKNAVDTRHNAKLTERWKDSLAVLHLGNYFVIRTVIRR